MKHIKEFSKQAHSYDANTIVQKEVASYLLAKVENKPKKILDLGCGTGYINKKIDWKYDRFIGVDNAKGMCDKHPKSKDISVLNKDFEDLAFQKEIFSYAPFDLVISSSAMQWAKDIEELIKFTSTLTNHIAFSIFTCKTFEDIYSISGLKTFLPQTQELIDISKKYFDIQYEIKTYRLEFKDNISKFRYIKRSGISGGEQKLTLSQTKKLIEKYPHSYLEFEVIFIFNSR